RPPTSHSFPTRRSSDLSPADVVAGDTQQPNCYDLALSCEVPLGATPRGEGPGREVRASSRAAGKTQRRPGGRRGASVFLRRSDRSEEHTSELQSLAYLV